MKKFIVFILTLAAFLFSLFPTTVASIYMLGGGKQGMIEFISQIPSGRFWLFGLSFFIVSIAGSVTLMYFTFDRGLSPDKPKSLSVDDPDLSRKLSKLWF